MTHMDMQPGFVFSPQPMYMIGTNNADGKPNFCIITWLGFSADDGPALMMTIGGTKLTKTNILREGHFSANLITEDTLWLADYFGSVRGEERAKTDVPYTVLRGRQTDVPVIGESHWIYECEVKRNVPLGGSDLFVAGITNMMVDEDYRDMDMERIDLGRIRPAIYSPYQYFSIGERLGGMGEWKAHYADVDHVKTRPEKADGANLSKGVRAP